MLPVHSPLTFCSCFDNAKTNNHKAPAVILKISTYETTPNSLRDVVVAVELEEDKTEGRDHEGHTQNRAAAIE